jgi:hypothetical protein
MILIGAGAESPKRVTLRRRKYIMGRFGMLYVLFVSSFLSYPVKSQPLTGVSIDIGPTLREPMAHSIFSRPMKAQFQNVTLMIFLSSIIGLIWDYR